MSTEQWRPVLGNDHYEVSDLGNVRSVDRVIVTRNGHQRRLRGQPLKPAVGKRGYSVVSLGHSDIRYVHTLVLEAFVSPRPDGQQGRHGDDDRTNAALTNLSWGTPVDNAQDAIARGRNGMLRRQQCPRLHPLDAPNLAPSSPGRRCLACSRAQNWCRYHQRPDLLKIVSDAYYAHITGDGGAALRALGIGLTSGKSLVVIGGNTK